MAGFVKINFDAVDDFENDGVSSPNEDFDGDFFMDDSSGDSFVMADEVDEGFDNPLLNDDDDDEESIGSVSPVGGGSSVEPLFKRRFDFAGSADEVSVDADEVVSGGVDGSLSSGAESGSVESNSADVVVDSSVGGSVSSTSVDTGSTVDDLDDLTFVNPLLVDDDEDELYFSGGSIVEVSSDAGSSSVSRDDLIFDNPLLDDEDELDFSAGVSSGSSSGDDSLGVSDSPSSSLSSVVDDGSSVVNPFLDDFDEEEDAPFLGFDAGVVGSSSGGVVEESFGGVSSGSVSEVSDDSGSSAVGDLRGDVQDLVDESVSVEEFSVPVVVEDRGSGEGSVVVNKRGPRFVESEFRRKNVSEVVVSDEVGEAVEKPGKQRYRYVREDGRLNGAELDFFKRLGVSRRDREAEDERLRLLRGRIDGVDTVAARKARNVLFGEAIGSEEFLKRGSKFRFSEMDREVLQFLAKFRYVKDEHLAIAFHRASSTMYSRLKKLRGQGLVLDKRVYGSRPVWFLTEAGMLLSGYDLPRVTEGKMSTMMFPHQFTVNHVAANLWGADVNVLNLENFPERNRRDSKGVDVFGERVVGEVEIQSSFGRMKMFDKAEVFVPELKANVDRAFEKWEKSGGVSFGESPEFQIGHEYMWALLPPASLRKAYHVPDLVVKRSRNSDGSPESIAVEVEINNKDTESYEKVLRAYRADDRIFKKVIWVCKSVGPARKLEKVAKNIGLWQEGRIDIVPVITEHGIFKERDMWFI